MLIKSPATIASSEITAKATFKNRRVFIKALVAGASLPLLPAHSTTLPSTTPLPLIKNYTNYYEFGFDKQSPSELAQALVIKPWTVAISGEVEQPTQFYLDDLLKKFPIEERIYRFRCVEGWSMVVPWQGFALNKLLKYVKPLSTAKFVKFTSIMQPDTMPAQNNTALLAWPYVEGLRLDEALHPLTLLATGYYDEPLAKQNGAPLRLIVPWKYGFKSIKAVVKIELLKAPPLTSWNKTAPRDYGFYANVNPFVAHPRWSQYSERLLGSAFFSARRNTELFNGYGEQVASLYDGMDLRHFF